MKKWLIGAAVIAALAGGVVPGARAEGMRPEVGKPLAKARQLLAAHSYAAAMAEVRIAANVRGLTPDESFIVEEMRGSIAESSGDNATASPHLRGDAEFRPRRRRGTAAAAAGRNRHVLFGAELWRDDRLAGQVFQGRRPTRPEMRNLLISCYYKQKDYASAARLQAALIAAEVKARQKPTEAQLDLLAACQRAMGDAAGFQNTMVQLVFYYAKPDYWANLIHSAQTAARIQRPLPAGYLPLRAGGSGSRWPRTTTWRQPNSLCRCPCRAKPKRSWNKGYAAGVLGSGPGAARQKRLQDLVTKTYASELAAMPGREADAQSNHDGNPLVGLGEEYVSYGQFPKGISLIEAG